jgi:ATP-dependent Clp protease ATP-binding subunit ClpA
MFERYSILARQAVMVARIEAGQVGADQIDSEHLLIGVLTVHPELPELLKTSIELSQLRRQCDRWHTPSSPIPNSQDLPIAPDLERVFARVASIPEGQECPEIRTEHLILSMAGEPCHASQMLADCGISEESLQALANVHCEAPQPGTAASLEAMKVLFSDP